MSDLFRKIPKADVYQTSDGEYFKDVKAACKHQLHLDFREWYNQSHEMVCDDITVDEDTLFDWLTENRTVLQQFLSVIIEF